MTARALRDRAGGLTDAPLVVGSDRSAARAASAAAEAEDPVACSSGPVVVSVCWVSASSRWAGSTLGWPEAAASRAAAEKASCALVVS